MMTNVESAAVISIAKQLIDKGYDVVIDPDPSLIPFSLDSYRPDLLARSDAETLLVEVKSRNETRSIERYRELAQRVASHPGWRFLLTTVDAGTSGDPVVLQEGLNRDAIPRSMAKVEKVFETENYDIGLPYLWNIYISGMRIAADARGIPVDATNDSSVLNYMYSLGELSHEALRRSREFFQLRNRLAHTLESPVSQSNAIEYLNFVRSMLQQWGLVEGEAASTT